MLLAKLTARPVSPPGFPAPSPAGPPPPAARPSSAPTPSPRIPATAVATRVATSSTKDGANNINHHIAARLASAPGPGAPNAQVRSGIVFDRIDQRVEFFGVAHVVFIPRMFARRVHTVSEQDNRFAAFDALEFLIDHLIHGVIKPSAITGPGLTNYVPHPGPIVRWLCRRQPNLIVERTNLYCV